jgi:hypothetical protein
MVLEANDTRESNKVNHLGDSIKPSRGSAADAM